MAPRFDEPRRPGQALRSAARLSWLAALSLRLRWSRSSASTGLARALWPFGEIGAAADATLRAVESERGALLRDRSPLAKVGAPVLFDEGRTVADACRVSMAPAWARVLFRLALAQRARRAIEVGTNVGITSAYLATALRESGGGRLTTVEGSPHRSGIARELHRRLGLDGVEYAVGLFDDVLPGLLAAHEPFDLAFIDGNHEYEPTLRYFEWILARGADPMLFVFDDIRYGRGARRTMTDAWRDIRRHPAVSVSADLGQLGVCVTGAV